MKYKVTLNNRVYEVEVEQGEAMLVDTSWRLPLSPLPLPRLWLPLPRLLLLPPLPPPALPPVKW